MTASAERRKPGRPATGTTPTRSMRIGDVYDQAKAKAEANGTTITAVVERKLTEYLREGDPVRMVYPTATYRPGAHWGRTIIRKGDGPADGDGRRPDDRLVAVVDPSAPEWLAAWICTLLNADICDCGHERLDRMFHLNPCPIRKAA